MLLLYGEYTECRCGYRKRDCDGSAVTQNERSKNQYCVLIQNEHSVAVWYLRHSFACRSVFTDTKLSDYVQVAVPFQQVGVHGLKTHEPHAAFLCNRLLSSKDLWAISACQGHAHAGMLAGAQWLFGNVTGLLEVHRVLPRRLITPSHYCITPSM